MDRAFQHPKYLLRRQILALTGKLRLYGANGELLLYCQQKMFKLKEDIRVYKDESRSQELLFIQARKILDFAAAYDIYDSQDGQKIGAWRRKGFQSFMRDQWHLLDTADNPYGLLVEDNLSLALLRRFVAGSWIPQNYDLLINGARSADLRQRFNPFRYELEIDLSLNSSQPVDPRLGIAAGVLLAIIEGRQE
jgi:hypothetical protein